MPIANEKVIIAYYTQQEFDNIQTKNDNTIYFITDTKKIFVGNSLYCDIMERSDTKVTQEAPPSSGIFDLLMAKTSNNHATETNTINKSGSLNYNINTNELYINGNRSLTNADIVICTQAEYDAMQTRTGLICLIKE